LSLSEQHRNPVETASRYLFDSIGHAIETGAGDL